jgi:hypothetical protein
MDTELNEEWQDEGSAASAPRKREIPTTPLYRKIDVVINETANFLAQYVQQLQSFGERYDTAMRFIGENRDDVHPPNEVYRPFSEFRPL